jgi:hypothetical protein
VRGAPPRPARDGSHQVLVARLSIGVIAEIMGWDKDHDEKIIRRYVGRQAATKAATAQINR